MRCRLRSSRYKTCFLLRRPPHPAKIKDFCHLRSAERPVGGSDSPQDCHSLPPTALCLPQGEGLAAAPQSFTQLLDKRKFEHLYKVTIRAVCRVTNTTRQPVPNCPQVHTRPINGNLFIYSTILSLQMQHQSPQTPRLGKLFTILFFTFSKKMI